MPTTPVTSLRYLADTRTSQFTVQAFANGLIAVMAHSPKFSIRDWTGEIQMADDGLSNLSMAVRVKTESLEVLDELSDKDRRELNRVMHQEVLESARFSEVVFKSSETEVKKLRDDLYRIRVRGPLTFHGVTNDHSFVSHVSISADSARAYGEFTLRQSDYDIRIASIAGGHIKLQDELKFSFYVIARKQP
jgi:polyisoprenoid-binding protein YceI